MSVDARNEPHADGELDAGHAWPPVSRWQVRSFRGTVVSDERLAATSGPKIALVVAALCIGLGLSVVWRGEASETVAGFWPPTGAAFVAMLVVPTRRWGWVVLGILAPSLIGLVFWMVPVNVTLWWALANVVEPAFAALVLRRWVSSRSISSNRRVLLFLGIAVVLAPMIGGALGSIGTSAGGDDRPFIDVWLEWVAADGLGVLVMTPMLMTATSRRSQRTPGEMTALIVLIATATGLAFIDLGAKGAALLPYLILAGLVWAGMRFGTRAVAGAGFVVALGANVAAGHGYGPFADSNGHSDVVTLQIFLAIALITSFVVAALASDLADRDEVHRLLTRQATHDALTGLPNRVLLGQKLNQALQARDRTGRSVAVLMIDLDDFKKINDRHGHPTGDEALGVIAGRLRRSLRPGHFLARLGGDEFVVLCDDLSDSGDVRVIARELLRGLERPIEVAGGPSQLTGSIGIAVARRDDPATATDLMRRADIALYHCKRTDGLSISLFDDELEAHTRRRAELDEELHGAIERGEMFVQYQPVVSLSSGNVSQCEALARWTNRRFGVVGPDEFIAIAESSSMINVIGEWVMATACRQAAAWRLDDPSARVAVNVSARQLSDGSFPERVRAILDDVSLPPSALVIEITETAVMDDLEVSARVLEELVQLGVSLSLDDFGTGYASLTYLRRIPVNSLKIDRSFVAGLGVVPGDLAIVESIINLGHSIGIQIVAEGIETLQQQEHLIRLGCDQGQGFLFSKPVDGVVAAALIHRTFELSDPLAVPFSNLHLTLAPFC